MKHFACVATILAAVGCTGPAPNKTAVEPELSEGVVLAHPDMESAAADEALARELHGAGGTRGSRGGFRQNSRGETYKAVCSDCGQDFGAPFKPRSDRPVYCQTCFEKRRSRR